MKEKQYRYKLLFHQLNLKVFLHVLYYVYVFT